MQLRDDSGDVQGDRYVGSGSPNLHHGVSLGGSACLAVFSLGLMIPSFLGRNAGRRKLLSMASAAAAALLLGEKVSSMF